MKSRFWSVAAVSLTAVALLAGCGGSGAGSGSSGSSSTKAQAAPTPAPLVKTATVTVDGKQQTILVDNAGMTLYLFTPDKGGKISCTGPCLAVWPPLLLPADMTKPVPGPGLTGTCTTLANPDGKGTQILYNNWPLYYYAKDKAPGDVTGQNVGGKWFVVTPDVQAG